jgi:hypothetical protein
MNIAEFTNSGCFTTEFMNSADWPIEPHSILKKARATT